MKKKSLLETDLVIVGAGLSSALIFSHVKKAGIKPVIFEAEKIGGKSLYWGAWCSLPNKFMLQDAANWNAAWPISHAELQQRANSVMKWLGAKPQNIPAHLAKVTRELQIQITPKHYAHQRLQPITSKHWLKNASVKNHHKVVQIEWNKSGSHLVTYQNQRTRKNTQLLAKKLVLAAGPLETTRLLLQSNIADLNPHANQIGKNLTNHQVASFLLIAPRQSFGEVFQKNYQGKAVIPRFINSSKTWQRAYSGGFTTELAGPYPCSQLLPHIRKKLGVKNSDAFINLQLMGECAPHAKRLLKWENGKIITQWHWTSNDRKRMKDMHTTAEAIAATLNIPNSQLFQLSEDLELFDGHEASTCRMGSKHAATPCDQFGRLRGVPNAWVADSSIMPTATDCHPTVSLLALVSRVAEQVCAR